MVTLNEKPPRATGTITKDRGRGRLVRFQEFRATASTARTSVDDHDLASSHTQLSPQRQTLDVRRIPYAMILPLDFCRYSLPSRLRRYAAISAIYPCVSILIAVAVARLLFFI